MIQALGGTVVLLRKFDAEGALAVIEKHGVTHSQWVPTMFVRMLKFSARGARALRHFEHARCDPCRRTAPSRGEAGDEPLVEACLRGVLLRDRDSRHHHA